jgi:hypothetical protein
MPRTKKSTIAIGGKTPSGIFVEADMNQEQLKEQYEKEFGRKPNKGWNRLELVDALSHPSGLLLNRIPINKPKETKKSKKIIIEENPAEENLVYVKSKR